MTEPLATVTTTGSRIRATGEIDMSNADLIGARIRADADPASPATLDLSAVTFFDSSALNMLIALAAEFDRAGGKLTVAAAEGSIVERLLTITHMEAYLNLALTPRPGD
jgi:anti-anti-sigma factor